MRRGRHRGLLALTLVNVVVLGSSIGIVIAVPAAPERPHLIKQAPVQARPVLSRSALQDAEGPDGGRGIDLDGAISEAMRSPAVGKELAAMVVDPASGRALFGRNVRDQATPASTTKILTAAAALAGIGPGSRLTTEVVRAHDSRTITLVGGGDPTLASPAAERTYPEPARLGQLAKRAARSLRESGTSSVRLRYDASLFKGPDTAPTWKSSYVPYGYVSPVTALSIDAGRVDPVNPDDAYPGPSPRVSDPPRVAATTFASLLEDAGITVRGSVAQEQAQESARRVAAVRSPPVAVLVEQMLTTSDNDLAEALGRHVALAVGKPATFEGAAAAVERVVAALGVPTERVELYDCSGLSHQNKLTARSLARVLSLAAGAAHPELRTVLTGLPVAGYTGTLGERYGDGSREDAAGYVRAKTGTLNHVTSLAGVAYRPDGRMLVFAFLANDVPIGATGHAELALDRVATRLAGR